jgi:hypothetical protein
MNEINLAAMFAAYWGADVQICYPSSNFPQYLKVDAKFLSKYLRPTDKCPETLAYNAKWNKLCLKPLSSITDEDAIEVAKMIDYNITYSFGVPTYEFDTVTGYNFEKGCDIYIPVVKVFDAEGKEHTLNVITESVIHSCDNSMHIIDYLRSKSYDLGYLNIPSLIKSGYAIEK